MISRPMLAATLPTGVYPPFGDEDEPVGVTPKVDGIRALVLGGRLVSRSLKPIPNLAIRSLLEAVLPEGADGEIMAGGGPSAGGSMPTFQQCTSMVMSVSKVPPRGTVKFFMFDYVRDDMDKPYARRMEDMAALRLPSFVVRLTPQIVADRAELDAFESACLAGGYEGVMLRRMFGRYKPGRSTLREGLLCKMKRFVDAEATVIGAEELTRESEPDTRSGLLGALVVRMAGVVFRIGTGFSAADRAELWLRRHEMVRDQQLVSFKYMPVGVKVAPRFPVFRGLRHADDA